MTLQHLKTELPGSKARAMIARDAEVISPSYPRDYPFVMSHGRGTEVWDVDGNRFLEFRRRHRRVRDRPRASAGRGCGEIGGRRIPAYLQ